MKLAINDLNYHVEVRGKGTPLLLLHGFTGSVENWYAHLETFAAHFTVIAVDLPGHGRTDEPPEPQRYHMEHVAADLAAIIEKMAEGQAHVLGYSMGGRLALYLAVHHAERVHSLVLENASPGLATEKERAERVQQDEALATKIEIEGITEFVAYWENLPLFESHKRLPLDAQDRLREGRMSNLPGGLANSLRGMGAGVQPPLWDALPTVAVPVLIINGALDVKFTAIGDQMAAAIPGARRVIVPDAGHTVHLEQPEAFQRAVLDFLM